MSLSASEVSLVLGDGTQQARVLDDVSLEVAKGELVAVLGPSGAGKSSLLAVCGGLRRPTSGRIVIDGVELGSLSDGELTRVRRDRIGFVFQQSNLVPALRAVDQLLLMAHLQGKALRGETHERALLLLDSVGMGGDKLHRRPDQLSGGERQRIGIARALMTNPGILLVDEPTSMLDTERGREIVRLLARQCHDHGVSALMVTHDRGMLEFVDRVVEMKDGRCVAAQGVTHAAHSSGQH
jgi:putative ABC transport system ATP-binding protein